MAEKLEFDLTVTNNQLSKALGDGSKQAGLLENSLSTALGVFGGNLALKGLELLKDGLGEVVAFGRESVKAFSEQEDALNQLGQALKASGEFSNTAVDDFNSFASALQKSSVYGDELVISQLAIAKAFGASNNQAKALVQAAANLSATFGGDLGSNVEKLGKTLNGTLGKLAQYIPELKNLTKEQLAAGAAADIINEKFGGSAAAQLNTYSGSVTAASNAFSDMQEEVGRFIAKNSVTMGSLSGLKSGFEAMGLAIKNFNDYLGVGLTPIQEQKKQLGELGAEYNKLVTAVESLKKMKEATEKFKHEGDEAANLERIKELDVAIIDAEQRQNEILKERQTLRSGLLKDKEVAADTANAGGRGQIDDSTLDNRKKLNNELLALDNQLALERNNLDVELQNSKIADDQTRQAEELQRIIDFNTTKTELEFQLREANLATMQEGTDKELEMKKLAQEKELALLKVRNDGLVKMSNLQRETEKKDSANKIALQQATASTITGILGASANAASVIFKDGSKEQFIIQKAAALAQAIVAMNLATAMANTIPPPGNIPAIAAARANGMIAISGIVAASIKGFADGGIIGNSNGASMGPDNRVATVRDGEMILNAQQQKNLFDMIASGGGSGDIVIQIDGDTIFRVVRNKIKQGYKLS